MESRSPNPVSSRALQPATPTTVIIKRFLYRNRLRAVTLTEKGSRRHTKGMCSSQMRLPALGAFGRMRAAGQARNSAHVAHSVASRILPTVTAAAQMAMSVRKGVAVSGRKYIMP